MLQLEDVCVFHQLIEYNTTCGKDLYLLTHNTKKGSALVMCHQLNFSDGKTSYGLQFLITLTKAKVAVEYCTVERDTIWRKPQPQNNNTEFV